LHHLAALLCLATPRAGRSDEGLVQRRRRQQLRLAQRLLDPLPDSLRPADDAAERFWRILRWGGLGLVVARLLGG
jgi:hypothetical protein